MSPPSSLIDGYLVSICLASEERLLEEVAKLAAASDEFTRRLRYWEIVYVIRDRDRARLTPQATDLARLTNLRIIIANDDISYYRRRAIAASEAIGDVIVLTGFRELQSLDLVEFAADAYAADRIVLGRRAATPLQLSFGYWFLNAISAYRVNASDLQTIALPRSKLNALLDRKTLALDLRFEAKRGGESFLRKPVNAMGSAHSRSGVADRYALLEELISTSSGRYLKGYAGLSLIVAMMAFLYAAYAVGIVLFKPDVQEGWFSTALVQSGSVGFLAIGFAVLCLGLADIAESLSGRSRQPIMGEISNVDLFSGNVDLNVEVVSRPPGG